MLFCGKLLGTQRRVVLSVVSSLTLATELSECFFSFHSLIWTKTKFPAPLGCLFCPWSLWVNIQHLKHRWFLMPECEHLLLVWINIPIMQAYNLDPFMLFEHIGLNLSPPKTCSHTGNFTSSLTSLEWKQQSSWKKLSERTVCVSHSNQSASPSCTQDLYVFLEKSNDHSCVDHILSYFIYKIFSPFSPLYETYMECFSARMHYEEWWKVDRLEAKQLKR